jgi:endoglucanase
VSAELPLSSAAASTSCRVADGSRCASGVAVKFSLESILRQWTTLLDRLWSVLHPKPDPPAHHGGLYASGVKYRGINRSGAEYGDDWDGWNGGMFLVWPSPTQLASELNYLDGKGFNCIRLPISWERIQHTLLGALNSSYRASLSAFVAQATAAGFTVVVDLHNYNRYAKNAFTSDQGSTVAAGYEQLIYGGGELTSAHVIDIWKKIAALFAANHRVIFNLMNEPHDMPVQSSQYFSDINDVIAAIRDTGATNLILVPNSRGSDVTHWSSYAPNGGPLDSAAALAVVDSATNYAFDIHQYLDDPQNANDYIDLLAPVTIWARTNQRTLFLSEMGVPATAPNGQAAVAAVLQFLNTNADVWVGWSVWNLPPHSITGTSYTVDGPAMAWYTPYLTALTASS